MNKDLLNQLPADEQPVASKLDSLAGMMHPSPGFQWELETRLIEEYKSKTEARQSGWFMKAMVPIGWALVAGAALFLLNWTLRSISPGSSPAATINPTPEIAFETNVRQGNICAGPLAVGHGFDVFLTNADKTDLIPLDPDTAIGELRSFSWSPDGEQLAVIGNSMGQCNIYITDPAGGPLEYLLSSSRVGNLMDVAWSRDGKQFLMWSSRNNSVIYLLNTDGTGLVEKSLDVRILGRPQFAPDGRSIVYYGTDLTSGGLFRVTIDGSQSQNLNPFVEDATGFAFSPDGLYLAYVSMDRVAGAAMLMKVDMETGAVVDMLGSLPIPKGSGSSIPRSANLSWSPDGKFIVFEFGRYETDRSIYLAYTDGTGLVKVVESAHAPAVSADGKCLAYIRDKQIFLTDLGHISSTSPSPVFLADLPLGRAIADSRLDSLQWKP